MAWNASGVDRIRSYKVYKELEAERDSLRERMVELTDLLDTKDATIRQLAYELAQAIPGGTIGRAATIQGSTFSSRPIPAHNSTAPDSDAAEEAAHRNADNPPAYQRKASGVVPRVVPAGLTLRERLTGSKS